MQAFYLARQPIYDDRLCVAGYELLYRDGPAEQACFGNGDIATSDVLTSSVIDIGLAKLVGSHPAFINATASFLRGELPLPEVNGQIVLEVLEDIVVDDALIARLAALSGAGYRLALDDFVYRPGCEPLLAIADFVKLDVCALSRAQLAEQVALLRPCKAQLIAEKVETYESLEICRELGFDLFQGYFFCRPKLICGQRSEAGRLTVLQLLAKLQDPDADMADLERLVTCDPTLTYRLLKYINSAYCGIPAKVNSIHQALVLVGTDTVRNWATLMLMSRLSETKPSELITVALIRARMCEMIGLSAGGRDANEYFTVGLLSVLDALLDLPMVEVVDELPVDEELSGALCARSGHLGEALARVVTYECGAPGDADLAEGLAGSYIEAVGWAREMQQAVS